MFEHYGCALVFIVLGKVSSALVSNIMNWTSKKNIHLYNHYSAIEFFKGFFFNNIQLSPCRNDFDSHCSNFISCHYNYGSWTLPKDWTQMAQSSGYSLVWLNYARYSFPGDHSKFTSVTFSIATCSTTCKLTWATTAGNLQRWLDSYQISRTNSIRTWTKKKIKIKNQQDAFGENFPMRCCL